MLEFHEPTLARSKEIAADLPLLFPRYPFGGVSGLRDKLKVTATTYRNLVAWYLKAAGLSGAAVGDYLSISASRANGLASRSRKALFSSPWTKESMQFIAEQESLSDEAMAAHRLAAMRIEMMAAEQALDKCSHNADLRVVSGALRMGRAAYSSAYDTVAGTKCTCRMCSIAPNKSLGPYWLDYGESP